MKGIMIQGTSSDAGKTFIVTGLCRLLADMGVKVCPFKSQNMSNNSHLTPDGLELSTAQALQAQAARLSPAVFMNPILLKPRSNCSSEIILNGRVYASTTKGYRTFTQTVGIQAVRESLAHIAANFDAAVIEGAGSPAEVNLNASEIVNMRVAREADVPVLLVADVDRGGSLASVVGTLELLGQDRRRVKGLIFNKFRGDIALFRDAVTWTENYTGLPVLGVLPYLEGVTLPAEDSLNIREHASNSPHAISIGVLKFPGISNFSDFDPFTQEQDVKLSFIDSNVKWVYQNDALIFPGTKTTYDAMNWLRNAKIYEIVRDFHGFIFGICGGLQIMGRTLFDPLHIENDKLTHLDGLGLLPFTTEFAPEKITRQHTGKISGYEIHYGRTTYNYSEEYTPLFVLNGQPEGMRTKDLRLACTYLHGVFENDEFRTEWLNAIRRAKNYGTHPISESRTALDRTFDAIAEHLRRHLDVEAILRLSQLR